MQQFLAEMKLILTYALLAIHWINVNGELILSVASIVLAAGKFKKLFGIVSAGVDIARHVDGVKAAAPAATAHQTAVEAAQVAIAAMPCKTPLSAQQARDVIKVDATTAKVSINWKAAMLAVLKSGDFKKVVGKL